MVKLQRAQNALARVVLQNGSQSEVGATSRLQTLHWLPVRHRIPFKVAMLAFKVRSTGQPNYLKPSITDYIPPRTLRSSTATLLLERPSRTVIASRAFSRAAPSVWNSLPRDIRVSSSLGQFKSQLRRYLYQQAFQ